jgi:hypothetical protein
MPERLEWYFITIDARCCLGTCCDRARRLSSTVSGFQVVNAEDDACVLVNFMFVLMICACPRSHVLT